MNVLRNILRKNCDLMQHHAMQRLYGNSRKPNENTVFSALHYVACGIELGGHPLRQIKNLERKNPAKRAGLFVSCWPCSHGVAKFYPCRFLRCGSAGFQIEACRGCGASGKVPAPVPEDEWRVAPRYNVAPSQLVPVVREHPRGERHVIQVRWSLVPSWARSPEALKQHPVNARCEGVESKPMFCSAFRHCRVLVPARGFYEWQAPWRQQRR